MFVKLHLHTGHCFSVLWSPTKTVPKPGVSASPLENIEPFNNDRKSRVLRTPNRKGVLKDHLGESQRPRCERINGGLVQEPKRHSFVEKSDSGGDLREGNGGFAEIEVHAICSTKWVNPGERSNGNAVHESGERSDFVEDPLGENVKNKNFGEEFERGSEVSAAKKVHAKCSTKGGSYGGCIPAILQALDAVSDLDEALKPWEESLSNKERSIILKEQLNWERALEIFEWFKRKGCYELNVIHYNIVLRILGRARKWSHVESLWDEMCLKGIAPVNSTYGTLIDVYSKCGLKEEALCWLARMNEQGMEPDEVTMAIVVQLYKKAGEFRKAEDFFEKWSLGERLSKEGKKTESVVNSRVFLSSRTYNTLIDTYGKAGQLKEASEVFSQMLREGIAPTTVTFNTMIHICGNHGRLEEVASLMQKMEELRCPPDTRTYNILISLYAKLDDVTTATKYFTRLKEALLEPDLVSYRTLLYAYSIRHMVSRAEDLISEMDSRGLEIDERTQSALTRMYIEAGNLEKSCLWFRRFHLRGNMSSECYSANIDAYGERGYVSEAENVFRCCQEMKRLSVLEFNVMIKAYGIGKRYREACAVFDSMESHGVVPDNFSYSSLIQILAGADMAHEAKYYLRKMEDSGCVSDCVPYCAVISSFTKLGKLEMAEILYKEMVGCDVQPDAIVFGTLINAFADVGCVKEALGYVDEMKKFGVPGNTVIFNSLIKLYTKVGFLQEAEEIYELLRLQEEGPAIYSSNCMIDLYTEHLMVKPAEGIFETLKGKGAANEFTFAMMLCMYRKIGQFDDAMMIARQMREQGLLTNLLSYNNVLALYATCGRSKQVVATFNELLKKPLRPDDFTFKSLAVVLLKSGISKQAVAKLEVSTKRDPQNGVPRWVSALSSVV